MGLMKSLKRKLGKKKAKNVEQVQQGGGMMDPLMDPLLADSDVKSVKNIQTGSAIGAIDKVKYHRGAVGKGKAKRGFFKANADMEDPMRGMTSQMAELDATNAARREEDRQAIVAARAAGEDVPQRRAGLTLSQDDKHMAARAVTSSRVDKLLGTDVLSEERFAQHNGQVGVTSMQVAGESLRVNEDASWKKKGANGSSGGTYFNFLDFDASQASVQRDLSNLQVNDYLTGQVDRHSGNMFYDDKTGRLRGIDNDLAFGDRFNEKFGDEDTGMAKHVNELPKYIDAETAHKILEIDLLDYWEMLQGDASDPQRLTAAEATDGMDRMMYLQGHIEALMAKARGEDVDVEGEIVGEWNQDTYDRQLGDASDSYIKRVDEGMSAARDQHQTSITMGLSRPGAKRGFRQDKQSARLLKEAGQVYN